ncbi:S8 family serine peptidase [Sphingomonas sp. LR61]
MHGSFNDIVKPDIAGPGVNVISAANGTGDGRMSMSGTSMATPDVAGIAALTFQAHPEWSAPQVKAALMNTATHDVKDGSRSATLLRQGTGRVDALQAVTAGTTVRSVENDLLVTASFGVVEVSSATTESRTLQIANTDGVAHTYDVAYQPQVSQPGVTFALNTKRVTVPANRTATVKLTFSIADPTKLRRVIDPTQESVQQGYQREFVTAASGIVAFTPTDTTAVPLRVGAYLAPKPVSSVQGRSTVAFTGPGKSADLTLKGRTVDQGGLTTGYHAAVAPFVLGGTDPVESFPAGSAKRSLQAADIRSYGASYDKASDTIAFGIQTAGPDANPGAVTNVEVLIDTNRDGEPDYLVYNAKSAAVDATFATTIDLAKAASDDPDVDPVVDVQPLNGGAPGQDVNTFDSSVKVLTTTGALIGAKGKFSYSVLTEVGVRPGCRDHGLLRGGRDEERLVRPVEAGAVLRAGPQHRRPVRRLRRPPGHPSVGCHEGHRAAPAPRQRVGQAGRHVDHLGDPAHARARRGQQGDGQRDGEGRLEAVGQPRQVEHDEGDVQVPVAPRRQGRREGHRCDVQARHVRRGTQVLRQGDRARLGLQGRNRDVQVDREGVAQVVAASASARRTW